MQKNIKIAVCGLLTAISAILGGLLNIPGFILGIYSIKIGLGTLGVILAGTLYGPGWGAAVGAAADILQALIFPKGAYVPFFTIVGVMFGLIPGLFFAKKQEVTFPRLLLAIASGQIVGSVICNTLLLVWLYGSPIEIIIARAVNQAIMIPLYTVIVYYLVQALKKTNVWKQR